MSLLSITGATTSPKKSILSAIEPTQSVFWAGEGGNTSATGRPKRVIRSGFLVLHTRSKSARHFALNSEMAISCIPRGRPFLMTIGVYYGHLSWSTSAGLICLGGVVIFLGFQQADGAGVNEVTSRRGTGAGSPSSHPFPSPPVRACRTGADPCTNLDTSGLFSVNYELTLESMVCGQARSASEGDGDSPPFSPEAGIDP